MYPQSLATRSPQAGICTGTTAPTLTFVVAFAMLTPMLANSQESYEGSFSASFPNQMQSCVAAQDQAERIVRERFKSRLARDSYRLSIGGKRCECSKNSRYATPLFDCIGYVVGVLEPKE